MASCFCFAAAMAVCFEALYGYRNRKFHPRTPVVKARDHPYCTLPCIDRKGRSSVYFAARKLSVARIRHRTSSRLQVRLLRNAAYVQGTRFLRRAKKLKGGCAASYSSRGILRISQRLQSTKHRMNRSAQKALAFHIHFSV